MRSRLLSSLVLFGSVSSMAGNGSAITYSMPPGGEGAASVALGVALPGGVSSMEVNPALLAWEGARTSSILQMSSSESELVPVLRLEENVTENVRSVGLRWPVKPGTDVALGYSWHEIDFGGNKVPVDDESDSMQSFQSTEDVQHFVLSARLGGIASVGVGMKWLDSRLAPGIVIDGEAQDGTAQALTWDLGILVAPRWRIPGTMLRVGPSLGISWINVADDSIRYIAGGPRDPVERMRRWGVAGEVSAQDLFTAQVFIDEEVDLATAGSQDAIDYVGWSVEGLGFYRHSWAKLTDPAGYRKEVQTSDQLTFDFKQVWRLLWRVRQGDFTTRIEDVPEDYPLPSWNVLGASITPNIRVVWTSSEIEGRSDRGSSSIRGGQERVAWSLCL